MPANWIAFARRDVQAADVLRHHGIYEESCLHAQQASPVKRQRNAPWAMPEAS